MVYANQFWCHGRRGGVNLGKGAVCDVQAMKGKAIKQTSSRLHDRPSKNQTMTKKAVTHAGRGSTGKKGKVPAHTFQA